jgi:glycosyltransferase involved in cell wall biosynthesis
MNTTVSVIIPNYNHAMFLDERIQSVLNQSYQDFELIILDDCSPDNGASRDVIEKYRNNPHISHIVYNDINSGSSFKQWHKGMQLAKGDLIWIAESDDSCDELLLEKLVMGFDKNTVFAFCKSYMYDVNGNKSNYGFQSVFKDTFRLSGKEFVARYLLQSNLIANASSVVFKKKAAENVNEQYVKMKAEGDWLFWIELAECGDVFFVNEEHNYFRFHETNTTSILWQNGITSIEHLVVFDYLMNLLEIPTKKRFLMRSGYIKYVQNADYKNNDIRSKVLRCWDCYYVYRLYIFAYTILYKMRTECLFVGLLLCSCF